MTQETGDSTKGWQLYRRFGKRAFDIVVAGTMLILLLPVLLFVAVLVRIFLGAPVFFCQDRPGRDDKIFKMVKFRTMKDLTDAEGQPLPDKDRMTRFGKLLRALSIDELPELVNVLRGEMSLVGPRPLLVQYLPLYSDEQRRRHEVRPGITGWAQVNGRNNLGWVERFKLDVWYVENVTFWNDLHILGLTVWKALLGRDVNQTGSATMTCFKGER